MRRHVIEAGDTSLGWPTYSHDISVVGPDNIEVGQDHIEAGQDNIEGGHYTDKGGHYKVADITHCTKRRVVRESSSCLVA